MKVVIVDDDKLVCAALKTIIENGGICVLGIGHSAEEGVALYLNLEPDIIIMDIRMEKTTGIEAATKILEQDSSAKVLFLTTFADDDYIIKAIKIGVKGYILKQNFEDIIPALNAIYSGQSVFGETVIHKLPDLIASSAKTTNTTCLTEKEIQLVSCVADGLSNKEIAAKLFLSEGTVRNYISSIMEKLELKSRTQLAVFYFEHLK